MGLDEASWHKSQEKIFAADNVTANVLKNPIQRQRVDVAVRMIGGPNLKVLDAGCCDLSIGELIRQNGNEVYGVDFPQVLKEAKGKGMDAAAGIITKLPFKDGSFHVCLSGELIEHQIDYKPMLQELKRVINPDGGRIVITTPNVGRLRNRLSMLFGDVKGWHEWDKLPIHCRFWLWPTLAQALTQEGFIITKMGTGFSEGEGCIIEDENTIMTFFQGQLPIDIIRFLQKLVLSTVPHPLFLRSFIVIEGQLPSKINPVICTATGEEEKGHEMIAAYLGIPSAHAAWVT